MTKRILVVWYSRGGTSSKVAMQLAKSLGADLDPIEESGSRAGFGGYVRSALEALAKGLPAIRTKRDPKAYDLVVVGTPVWVGTMSSPVRSYLYTHRRELPDLAFFAVMGGRGGEDTVAEMRLASGASRAPTCVLTQRDVEQGRHIAQCEAFAGAVRARLAGEEQPPERVPGVPVDFRARPITS